MVGWAARAVGLEAPERRAEVEPVLESLEAGRFDTARMSVRFSLPQTVTQAIAALRRERDEDVEFEGGAM